MFDQYSTDQLYELHSALCAAARGLHLAWAVHLKATRNPTNAAGDMSSVCSALAADVHAELKVRYAADQASKDAA